MKIVNIPFGKEKTITTLDDDGSTIMVERNYRAGSVVKPVRKEYEIRRKVQDKKQELAEYMRFRAEHADKFDLAFRIEEDRPNTDKPYYVIFCYKEISMD